MTDSQHTWFLRALTFLLWALAALSVVFWALRLTSPVSGKNARAVATAAVAAPDMAALVRVLGATTVAAAPQAATASRYALVGVVADQSRDGAALIAVQGKPARPYRVGSQVDDGLVLQSVNRRSASLGNTLGSPATVLLEMPQQQR